MRLSFILITLLPLFSLAQMPDLLQKADSLYRAKNYSEAARLGEAFFKIDSTCDGCAFTIAKYHALAGESRKAIYYLKQAFKLGYASKYLDKQPDLNNLHEEKEWPDLVKISFENYNQYDIKRAQKRKELMAKFKDWQKQWEADNQRSLKNIDTIGSAEQIYKRISSFNNFSDTKSFNNFLFLYHSINDSTDAPYTVLLPNNYHPNNSYAVLVVLHGAVKAIGDLAPYADSFVVGGFNRHFTKYAIANNMIVVYPYANSKYNWMDPDDGFSMVPSIVTYLKHFLNIDDNRVYLTGHSNGATGAFSYLMKAPNLFAAFTGMNTQPRVRTGGTFLMNAVNRSFYALATDKDYYYPPQANDTLLKLARNLGIDWKLDMNKGFPHWFPRFDAADEAVKRMFNQLTSKERNPFHEDIYWQCDDITYGRCDWLSITGLDTLKRPASWQKEYNFDIHPWIDNVNPDKVIDSTAKAFNYPRKSGTVKASFKNNQFNIQSSCVKSVKIYLSPEMVNFSKPLRISINGKQVFNKKVNYSKEYLLGEFEKKFDRKAIWVNTLDFKID